jgi:GABA(A) receptor-associated protein
MNKSYKGRYSFEKRVDKAKTFQESDPDKIMVIVERHAKSNLPELQSSKYLLSETDS